MAGLEIHKSARHFGYQCQLDIIVDSDDEVWKESLSVPKKCDLNERKSCQKE